MPNGPRELGMLAGEGGRVGEREGGREATRKEARERKEGRKEGRRIEGTGDVRAVKYEVSLDTIHMARRRSAAHARACVLIDMPARRI